MQPNINLISKYKSQLQDHSVLICGCQRALSPPKRKSRVYVNRDINLGVEREGNSFWDAIDHKHFGKVAALEIDEGNADALGWDDS